LVSVVFWVSEPIPVLDLSGFLPYYFYNPVKMLGGRSQQIFNSLYLQFFNEQPSLTTQSDFYDFLSPFLEGVINVLERKRLLVREEVLWTTEGAGKFSFRG
jgi:hypothetical protein